MKLKFGVLAILASTCGLLALVFFAISYESKSNAKNQKIESSEKNQDERGLDFLANSKPAPIKNQLAIKSKAAPLEKQNAAGSLSDLSDLANYDFDEEDDEFDEDDVIELSLEDRQEIEKLAQLSEKDLNTELNALKEKLGKEDLISQLEEGRLNKSQAEQAKKTLERFALLGMEATRRNFASIEPDLKDAISAHQNSIKEIREMLDEY